LKNKFLGAESRYHQILSDHDGISGGVDDDDDDNGIL